MACSRCSSEQQQTRFRLKTVGFCKDVRPEEEALEYYIIQAMYHAYIFHHKRQIAKSYPTSLLDARKRIVRKLTKGDTQIAFTSPPH